MPKEEKPFQPPLRVPVSEYQTPTPAVVFFSEPVDRLDPAYTANTPMKRGTLYSTIQGADQKTIDAYPNLYFLREVKRGDSDRYVNWLWTTVPNAEDTYNAEVDYVGDSTAAPRFTRVYTIQRDAYDADPALTIGNPLSGIVSVTVSNSGNGYQSTDTIQFNGGGGTGFSASIVVDGNGEIQNVVITNEGTGFTTVPTLTVVSANGAGAVLAANLQPQSSVLISQKKGEFAENDPMRNEFVKVIRVYETLPGPYITTYRVDEDGKTITVQRRHQLQSVIDAISPKETLITGTWTRISSEPVNESYFVGWEVHESRPIPGNVITDSKLDDAGNPITETKQMVATSSVVTAESISGGNVWIKKFGKSISELVSWQMEEDLQLPGHTVTGTKLDKDGNEVVTSKFLQKFSSVVTSETFTGDCTSGVWTKKYGEAVSDLVSYQVEEDVDVPGNTVETSKFRSDGSNIVTLTTLKKTSCITPGGNITGGFLSLTRIEDANSDVVSYEVVDVSLVPGPDVHGEHIDEKYGLIIDITKTIVPDGTSPSPNPALDGTYYEIKPHDKWQAIQIASKFDSSSLPSDTVWFAGMIYSFPPELTDARIDWATATCGCSSSFSADLIANMSQYHGPVKTRVTEQFYNGVPPDDVSISQFFPQSHNFGYAWFSACGTDDGSCRTKTGAPHFHIPLCLHGDLTLTIGAIVFTFPATTPSALPHGTYIMLPPHVERWRFGVFRRVLTEVFVPS